MLFFATKFFFFMSISNFHTINYYVTHVTILLSHRSHKSRIQTHSLGVRRFNQSRTNAGA